MMMKCRPVALGGLLGAFAHAMPAAAHGPLFSPAPETIWKGGTELTLGFHTEKATGISEHEREYQGVIEAEYGLAANWEAGIEIPYISRALKDGGDAGGIGDLILRTKYQLWRRDLPGAQYKITALLKLKLPTGDDDSRPRLGSGSTDITTGLVSGYESRRWYWFASAVYRANTRGSGGLEKGDRQFLNLVGGIRPFLTEYRKPDTVLMLELNWERAGRDRRAGAMVPNTGGWEMFLSPVVWWTCRQLAVRGGAQIRVEKSLKGIQPASGVRGRLEVVYHF